MKKFIDNLNKLLRCFIEFLPILLDNLKKLLHSLREFLIILLQIIINNAYYLKRYLSEKNVKGKVLELINWYYDGDKNVEIVILKHDHKLQNKNLLTSIWLTLKKLDEYRTKIRKSPK